MINKGMFGSKYLNFDIREREIPSLSPNQIVVKVDACGICGTDIHFVTHMEEPTLLGHEISAEIIDVGTEVKHLKVGDTVIVEDCTLCGVCDHCKRGEPELCQNMYTIGDWPGMGQYMVLQANSVVKYEGLDPITASLTEPLTVAVNSVLDADIPLGGSVAILGCGPLGLMAAQVARIRGAGYIAMTELETDTLLGKARLDLAKELDVDEIVNLKTDDIEEKIKRKVDRVIVSSPPVSIYDGLKIVAYGGKIVYFGLSFSGSNVIKVDINDMVFRKITLKPFFGEPALNFPISLELLKSGKIASDKLITHTAPFDKAQDLFASIVNKSEPVIKGVVLPNK